MKHVCTGLTYLAQVSIPIFTSDMVRLLRSTGYPNSPVVGVNPSFARRRPEKNQAQRNQDAREAVQTHLSLSLSLALTLRSTPGLGKQPNFVSPFSGDSHRSVAWAPHILNRGSAQGLNGIRASERFSLQRIGRAHSDATERETRESVCTALVWFVLSRQCRYFCRFCKVEI